MSRVAGGRCANRKALMFVSIDEVIRHNYSRHSADEELRGSPFHNDEVPR